MTTHHHIPGTVSSQTGDLEDSLRATLAGAAQICTAAVEFAQSVTLATRSNTSTLLLVDTAAWERLVRVAEAAAPRV